MSQQKKLKIPAVSKDDGVVIKPNPLSNKPHQVWKEYVAEGRIFNEGRPFVIAKFFCLANEFYKIPGVHIFPNEPVKPNFVRFVCILDTHENLDKILPRIPAGDVLIHCGDFTNDGKKLAILKFNDEIGTLPHKHNIVIAGNHESGFEDGKSHRDGTPEGYKLLTNCTYLQDSSIEIYGIKIYGSPWHTLSGYPFFRRPGNEILKQWNEIPSDTDILLTHTPPLGHCDATFGGIRRGCVELLNTVEKRVQSKFHIFGHIHEHHGISTNGQTTFINAVSFDRSKIRPHDPIVFDILKRENQ